MYVTFSVERCYRKAVISMENGLVRCPIDWRSCLNMHITCKWWEIFWPVALLLHSVSVIVVIVLISASSFVLTFTVIGSFAKFTCEWWQFFQCYEIRELLFYRHQTGRNYCVWWSKVKYRKVYRYSSLQYNIATPLRELACHMWSHSITCHPTEVTFPPSPQLKLVLDLATPGGCRAELT